MENIEKKRKRRKKKKIVRNKNERRASRLPQRMPRDRSFRSLHIAKRRVNGRAGRKVEHRRRITGKKEEKEEDRLVADRTG